MTTITELPQTPSGQPLDDGALHYHRLARSTQRYRWWKPLTVGLAATIAYLLMLAAFLVALAVAGLGIPGMSETTDHFLNDPVEDLRDPGTYALGMILVALMLPAVLLATRVLGARPVGLVSSVAGRVRWRWLLRCLAIAGAVYGAAQLGAAAVTALRGEPLDPSFESSDPLVLVGLALILVPVQASAEEYLFRGYLMQTLGAWFRHPAIAIALPVPLFVIGHDYEAQGMIDIAVFAFAAGWLTWRTGGLEAAIALHIVNNVAFSGLGAFGIVDLNATSATTTDFIASLLVTVGFAVVAVKVADRTGIERVRSLTR